MTSNICPMISSTPPPLEDGPGFDEDDDDDFGTFASAPATDAADSIVDNFADFSQLNSNNDVSKKINWENNHYFKSIKNEHENCSLKNEPVNGDCTDNFAHFKPTNLQHEDSDSFKDFIPFKREPKDMVPLGNEQTEEAGNIQLGKSNRDSGNFSMKSENTEGNRSNRNSGDYSSKSDEVNTTFYQNSADLSTGDYKSDEDQNSTFSVASEGAMLDDKADSFIQSPASETLEDFADLSETLCDQEIIFSEGTLRDSDRTQEHSSCSDRSVPESLPKDIKNIDNDCKSRHLIEDDLPEEDLKDYDDMPRFVDVPKMNTQDNSSQDSVTDSGLCSGSQQSDGSPLPSTDVYSCEPLSPLRLPGLDLACEEGDFTSFSGLDSTADNSSELLTDANSDSKIITSNSTDSITDEEKYFKEENGESIKENISHQNIVSESDSPHLHSRDRVKLSDCDIKIEKCSKVNALRDSTVIYEECAANEEVDEWSDFNCKPVDLSTNYNTFPDNQSSVPKDIFNKDIANDSEENDNFANFENIEEFADFSSSSVDGSKKSELDHFSTVEKTCENTGKRLALEDDVEFADFESVTRTENNIEPQAVSKGDNIEPQFVSKGDRSTHSYYVDDENEDFGEFNTAISISSDLESSEKLTIQQVL